MHRVAKVAKVTGVSDWHARAVPNRRHRMHPLPWNIPSRVIPLIPLISLPLHSTGTITDNRQQTTDNRQQSTDVAP